MGCFDWGTEPSLEGDGPADQGSRRIPEVFGVGDEDSSQSVWCSAGRRSFKLFCKESDSRGLCHGLLKYPAYKRLWGEKKDVLCLFRGCRI